MLEKLFALVTQTLQSGLGYINFVSGGNEMMAAALTAVATGVLLWLVKDLPRRTISYIKGKVIFTLYLDGSSKYGELHIKDIIRDVVKNHRIYSRRRGLVGGSYVGIKLRYVITIGRSLVLIKGKPFIFNYKIIKDNHSSDQKTELFITTFGFTEKSLDVIKNMLRDYRPDKNRLQIRPDSNTMISARGLHLKDALIPVSVKKRIFEIIKDHEKRRESSRVLNTGWSTVLLLKGPPGTGKTSLSRIISFERQCDLCPLPPLDQITGKDFYKRIIGKIFSTILIEEVDRLRLDEGSTTLDKDGEFITSVTNSDIMLTLDGPVPLTGQFIIMTTNHPDKLDPALRRKGRITEEIYVGYLEDIDLQDYFNNQGYEIDFSDYEGISIPLCDIGDVLTKHYRDYDKISEFLRTYRDNQSVVTEEGLKVVN